MFTGIIVWAENGSAHNYLFEVTIMDNQSFIYVCKAANLDGKWIENTSAEKRKAIESGCIYQSIYEYSSVPSSDNPNPACTGDLWIIAESLDDPALAIFAIRVLLRELSGVYPDLDLAMLRYYIEYNEYSVSGRVLVRIPSSLFGGEQPCLRQKNYHFNMLNKFLDYTLPEYPLSRYDLSRDYKNGSDNLNITDIISPYYLLSEKPVVWLPPQNCRYDSRTENCFTTEISHTSFMDDDIDRIWHGVQHGNEWHIPTKQPEGAPLEDAYLKAQYIPTASDTIQKNRNALELCPVYQELTKNVEALDKSQIEMAIGLFVPLGKAGLNSALKLFEGKQGFTKDHIRELFLIFAYNRGKIRCSEIQFFLIVPKIAAPKTLISWRRSGKQMTIF